MTRFHQGAVRPILTVSVVAAALAACGQAEQPVTGFGAASQARHHNRPASYDPPGPSHDPWGPYIREASRRFDVPERWIREVMRQESGGRATATSRAGAMGLMQVMPGTYQELRYRHGLGDDPYHPYDSIMAGTAYIREMYELYGSPAFLAAYNAGPRRLEDYLWGNRGLPDETRNYVARIGPRIIDSSPGRRAAPEVYAAAEIPLDIPRGARRMDGGTMLALREQRQRAVEPTVQLAQLPPGPIVRMDPIPDGSTTFTPPPAEPAPVQLASLGAGPVVRMDPIPDGSTPEGAARLAESAARSSSFSEPAPVVRTEPVIALPPSALASASPRVASVLAQAQAARPSAPPAARGVAPAAPVQLALAPAAPRQEPSRVPPAAQPGRGGGGTLGFSLIGSAQAATLPQRPTAGGGAGGGWAVQVGAFASENLARTAANQARDVVATLGARTVVQPVGQGRGTLYRARVTGLSRDAAQTACDRLRARGGCMVISPDAQG